MIYFILTGNLLPELCFPLKGKHFKNYYIKLSWFLIYSFEEPINFKVSWLTAVLFSGQGYIVLIILSSRLSFMVETLHIKDRLALFFSFSRNN